MEDIGSSTLDEAELGTAENQTDSRKRKGKIVSMVLEKETKLGAKVKSYLSMEEVEAERAGVTFDSAKLQQSQQPLLVLVTSVDEGGDAVRFGLQKFDRLLLIDDIPVESYDDYGTVLEILRSKRPLHLTFASHQTATVDEFEVLSKRSIKYQLNLEHHENALRSGNMEQIRKVGANGLMERYRPVFWRLLLNYLPEDMTLWEQTLLRQRALYEEYKEEFLCLGLPSSEASSSRPSRLKGQGWWETEIETVKSKRTVQQNPTSTKTSVHRGDDHNHVKQAYKQQDSKSVDSITADEHGELRHPLEYSPAHCEDPEEVDTATQKLREDHLLNVELRETIWKDVQRTHPGFHFFADQRCEIMERILFIYAKLNPGVEYVQGMNEIVAPILFVFGNASLEAERDLAAPHINLSEFTFEEHYEVDTFFCFCNLMGDIRDLYMQNMDSDQHGIKGKGLALMDLLRVSDYQVYLHLTNLEVDPQFFALRWITTLLSRELMLPDTVRLWDTIFSDPTRFETLLRVCCAMITLQRVDILTSDFAGCLQILQKYPPTDLNLILQRADDIRLGKYLPDEPYRFQVAEVLPSLGEASRAAKNVFQNAAANVNISTLASATSDFFKKLY